MQTAPFFFVFVTLSHGLFLLLAKNSLVSKKSLWWFHYIFNGILWLILIFWIIKIQFIPATYHFSFIVQSIGVVFLILGTYLASTSFRLLGMNGVMGSRFFFPEKSKKVSSGLYAYIQNPTYDGFFLMLIGGGFLFGILTDFYLAGLSIFLLNYFLASIENYHISLNPL